MGNLRVAPPAGPNSDDSGGATAITALVQAHRYAADAQAPLWEFAIELEHLLQLGLTRCDLRWMLHRGYARHGEEITPPGAPSRTFRPLAPTEFPPGTCVVLTVEGMLAFERHPQPCPPGQLNHTFHPGEAGDLHRPYWNRLAAAGLLQLFGGAECETSLVAAAAPPLPPPEATLLGAQPDSLSHVLIAPATSLASAVEAPRPTWDRRVRELYLGDQLVKRFRVPAINQQLVLDVFEEEGWPQIIDDPLPPSMDENPTRRLQATIRCLNRNRVCERLRFFGNGSGEVIGWESRL